MRVDASACEQLQRLSVQCGEAAVEGVEASFLPKVMSEYAAPVVFRHKP